MKSRSKTLSQSRATRVRKKLKGISSRPRLSIKRSLRYIYAQIIDDQKGKTLVATNIKDIDQKEKSKTKQAALIGALIAKKALKKKITKVAFDRGSNKYHGRVKALAESARKNGLIF